MTKERNLEGGTERDNGPLDALMKGERISTDELVVLILQHQFAKAAREQNELEDFDDDDCIGDCGDATREARLRREKEFYDIGGRDTFDVTAGFNRAAFDSPVSTERLAAAPRIGQKPVWTSI